MAFKLITDFYIVRVKNYIETHKGEWLTIRLLQNQFVRGPSAGIPVRNEILRMQVQEQKITSLIINLANTDKLIWKDSSRKEFTWKGDIV